MGDIETLRKLLSRVELVSTADIARRWGVSRQSVNLNKQARDFPEPVTTLADGQSLYIAKEVDDWRSMKNASKATIARRKGAQKSRDRKAK